MTVNQMLVTLDSHELAEQLAYEMASDPDWREKNRKGNIVREYNYIKKHGGVWHSGDVTGKF